MGPTDRRAAIVRRMEPSSPSLLDRSALVPVLIAFVIGLVAGTLLVNLWGGIAIGAVLAFSAVLRRYTAAKMEARFDEHAREHERGR